VFINELVAYLQLAALEPSVLSERSRLIMTYSLCGFANFGSLGIMIGGMTAMCPGRSADILRLAPRSIWSGLLATCMTGAIVGLVFSVRVYCAASCATRAQFFRAIPCVYYDILPID